MMLTFSLSSCNRITDCYGYCGAPDYTYHMNEFVSYHDVHYVIYDVSYDGNYIMANGNFKLDECPDFNRWSFYKDNTNKILDQQTLIDVKKTSEINNLIFNEDGTLDYQGKLQLYFNVGENYFDDVSNDEWYILRLSLYVTFPVENIQFEKDSLL